MNRRLTTALALAAIASAAGAAEASAAAFTSGDVVVYRVGAGTATLSSAATPVFLDEYTPTGTLVQSVALPTAAGPPNPLTASGTATSEGLLTRSADGSALILPGYAAAVGTAGIATTTSAAAPRAIGVASVAGTIDTSTTTTSFSGNNIRGVSSTNGTDLWATGGATGVVYTTKGATGPGTIVSNTLTNTRSTSIYDGQLYISTSSGTAVRIGTVGTGTPMTTGQVITNIPGGPTTGSPYQFAFADLNAVVPGVDTLYIADDTSATGGILKYSLVSNAWTPNGTIGTGADAYRGLTAQKVLTAAGGNGVALFAVRKGGSAAAGGGEVVTAEDDSGYNATATGTPAVVATAATNTAFRGVALAPETPTPTAVRWRGGTAAKAKRGVLVSWKVGADAKNLGFDVLRVSRGSAKRVKVTRKLIRGAATSSRRAFSFSDRAGKVGDRYYIVARSVDGKATVHGPLVVRAAGKRAAR